MAEDAINEGIVSEPNGNGSALKIVCAAMSGMLATILFMWMTFPRDLATNASINAVAEQFQKQLDQIQAEETIERTDREHLNIEMGQVQQRLRMEVPQ
jgi:hypothetical protein